MKDPENVKGTDNATNAEVQEKRTAMWYVKEILPYAVLILLGIALFIRSAYGFCQSVQLNRDDFRHGIFLSEPSQPETGSPPISG